jgi:hypothetical protein
MPKSITIKPCKADKLLKTSNIIEIVEPMRLTHNRPSMVQCSISAIEVATFARN